MKYSVGTKVVLKSELEPSSLIPGATVKIDSVRNGVYISYQGVGVWAFEDSDIDDNKTVDLEKDKVLYHYGGMLEELETEMGGDVELFQAKLKAIELEAKLKEALEVVEVLKDNLVNRIEGEE